MKLKRYLSLFCVLSLVTVTLFGCSSQSTETTVAQASAGNAQATSGDARGDFQPDSDMTYVQVQSIDDATITAVVGTFGKGDMSMPSGDDSQEAPSGTPSADAEQPAEQPSTDSGEQPADMPSGENGEQPSGDGSNNAPGGQGFTAGDETITFTIDDATAITLADGATGTIDDIAVDDVLAITLDDNNVALSVMIQQAFGADAAATTDAAG